MSRIRQRKTARQKQPAQSPVSRALRAALVRLQSGQPDRGLAALNQLARQWTDPARQARILGLVGDYELRRGKHREAVAAFHGGLAAAGADTRLAYRLRSGVVRALLAYGKPDLAIDQAHATLADLQQAEQAYRSALAAAEQDLAAGRTAAVPPRPFYASQAAARLGRLFMDAGELASAESLLMESLKLHPKGCPAVFTHLAHLSARTGRWDQAAALASRALDLGGRKATTLAAWQQAITARLALGQTGSLAVPGAMLATAQPTVRARAVLLAARTLRSARDPAWTALATDWLRTEGPGHPVVATEIRKLLVCDSAATANGSPADQAQAAAEMMQSEGLRPHEFMCAFRCWMAAGLRQNQALDPTAFVQLGVNRFGPRFGPRLLNTAANLCRAGQRLDQAHTLLVAALAGQPPATYWHTRIRWNLAGLLSDLQQTGAAAQQYLALARDEKAPDALRTKARLRLLSLAGQGGGVDVADVRRELDLALRGMDHYEAVLTLARDLFYSPKPEISALGQKALDKGNRLARAAFATATAPDVAAAVLFRWARRLLDMQQNAGMAELWDNLPAAKRTWLQSAGRDYWDFLALYYRALCRLGRSGEARRFVVPLLADPSTPDVGRLALGLAHGLQLVKSRSSRPEGLDVLRRLPREGALQPEMAAAAYWLALDAWQRGNRPAARDLAQHLKRCLGPSPGLKRHQQLLLCADLLLADLNLDAVAGRYSFASVPRLKAAYVCLQKDLAP